MSFQRVEVTEDVYWTSGKLKVEKGATGYISSMNQGYVGVVFDDNDKFVDLDGGGRRIQEVPYIWVKEIYTNVGTPGHIDSQPFIYCPYIPKEINDESKH